MINYQIANNEQTAISKDKYWQKLEGIVYAIRVEFIKNE